ncbi:hypothetical protein ACOMHN_043375 [Nucella lapillus]
MGDHLSPSSRELTHSASTAPSDRKSPVSLISDQSAVIEPNCSDYGTSKSSGLMESNRVGSSETLRSAPSKKNPFIMPPDHEIFVLRDKERQRKKQERIRQRKLHVHEKTTFTSRVNCRPAAMIHTTHSDDELLMADKAAAVADDMKFTIAITRDRHVEKESLAEYIAKKREMFLVQYTLGVKRDEMRKLEEIARAEERREREREQASEPASLLLHYLQYTVGVKRNEMRKLK